MAAPRGNIWRTSNSLRSRRKRLGSAVGDAELSRPKRFGIVHSDFGTARNFSTLPPRLATRRKAFGDGQFPQTPAILSVRDETGTIRVRRYSRLHRTQITGTSIVSSDRTANRTSQSCQWFAEPAAIERAPLIGTRATATCCIYNSPKKERTAIGRDAITQAPAARPAQLSSAASLLAGGVLMQLE